MDLLLLLFIILFFIAMCILGSAYITLSKITKSNKHGDTKAQSENYTDGARVISFIRIKR